MPNPPSPPRATMIPAMIPTICTVVLPRFPGIPPLSRHPSPESHGKFRHHPCPESNFGFSILPLNPIDDVEQVVYFQPIWLEVIDFMWEGVLGTAVWGGSAESGECFPRRVVVSHGRCHQRPAALLDFFFSLGRVVRYSTSEACVSRPLSRGRWCRCRRHPRRSRDSIGCPWGSVGRSVGTGGDGGSESETGERKQWRPAAKPVADQCNAGGAHGCSPRRLAVGPAAPGVEAEVFPFRHLDRRRRRHVSVFTAV